MKRAAWRAGVLLVLFSAAPVAQDRWADADRRTRRLPPSSFPALPGAVQVDLRARGCTIPQVGTQFAPHNVVRGRFRSAASVDWAVLCSVRRVSTIIVYWNGNPDEYSLLARAADEEWLQMIGPAAMSFSRQLSAVDPATIARRAEAAGLAGLPPLDHDGLDEAFAEKESETYYWLGDRWIRLPGSN